MRTSSIFTGLALLGAAAAQAGEVDDRRFTGSVVAVPGVIALGQKGAPPQGLETWAAHVDLITGDPLARDVTSARDAAALMVEQAKNVGSPMARALGEDELNAMADQVERRD
jgi:hypothetical protein